MDFFTLNIGHWTLSIEPALHQGYGKNRDGEENRDQRFRIARKIKVPHGVRPFNTVRRRTFRESLPCHRSVVGSEVAT